MRLRRPRTWRSSRYQHEMNESSCEYQYSVALQIASIASFSLQIDCGSYHPVCLVLYATSYRTGRTLQQGHLKEGIQQREMEQRVCQSLQFTHLPTYLPVPYLSEVLRVG